MVEPDQTILTATIPLKRPALVLILALSILVSPATFADTIRIASQNLNRLFDDIDDGNREKIASSKTFQQRLKITAETILQQLEAAHIIAFQEVENLNVLEKLADQITLQGGPKYSAILQPGNDVSSINVGYLVHHKLRIESSRQLFKDRRLGRAALFSRPPLLIKACLQSCITLVNLHLRSMRGLRSAKKGKRIALKRLGQATEIAGWVNGFQTENPQLALVILGDFNALTPADGISDIVGTIAGNPDNRGKRFRADDLVKQDLIDLTQSIPAAERYSYRYKGQNQILDYMLANRVFQANLIQIRFSPIRRAFSDHAGLLAEFKLP